MLVSHVQLATDDRLDPCLIAFLIEVQNAIHIAVVGNTHGWLAIFDCRGNNIANARRTVEHRILSVLMKMDKRIRHGGYASPDFLQHDRANGVDANACASVLVEYRARERQVWPST
jgi:hypothetical protein